MFVDNSKEIQQNIQIYENDMNIPITSKEQYSQSGPGPAWAQGPGAVFLLILYVASYGFHIFYNMLVTFISHCCHIMFV